MALIKCTECGKDISSEAEFCPSCGKPSSVIHRGKQIANPSDYIKENLLQNQSKLIDATLKVAPFLAVGYFFLLELSPNWPISLWAYLVAARFPEIMSPFLGIAITSGTLLIILSLCMAIINLFSKYINSLLIGLLWIILAIPIAMPPILLGLSAGRSDEIFGSFWTSVTRGLVIIGTVFIIIGFVRIFGIQKTKSINSD